MMVSDDLRDYNEFAAASRQQGVEPMPFDEWQSRWGTSSPGGNIQQVEPATDEELCFCGKEKGHRGRHPGVANLQEGADLEAEVDEAKLDLLPEIEVAPTNVPEPIVPDSPPDYQSFTDRELKQISPADVVRRFNTLDDNEIDSFFEILNSNANRDGYYWGVIENRKDYQKFCRLIYSALIELLSPYMNETQKQAVWTLILYTKERQNQ